MFTHAQTNRLVLFTEQTRRCRNVAYRWHLICLLIYTCKNVSLSLKQKRWLMYGSLKMCVHVFIYKLVFTSSGDDLVSDLVSAQMKTIQFSTFFFLLKKQLFLNLPPTQLCKHLLDFFCSVYPLKTLHTLYICVDIYSACGELPESTC